MGYTYILQCCDETFYTGSTTNIELRLQQHLNGEGARYTAKRLPVKIVYLEEYERIDLAFKREKQIQGWSHLKKRMLIEGKFQDLPAQSSCRNISHYKFRNLRSV